MNGVARQVARRVDYATRSKEPLVAGDDTKAGRVLLIRAWLDLNTSVPRYRYYPEWLYV